MSNESILKSLSRETKALIVVSEFEARRMPMFQMRAVLNEIVQNEEEKKVIIDLVENDLKATGYHPNQIASFLQDLLNDQGGDQALRTTRRLRSPFAMGFEVSPNAPPADAPAGAPPPAVPPPMVPPPVTHAPAAQAPAASVSRPSPFAGLTGGQAPSAPAAPPRPITQGLAPAGVPGLRVATPAQGQRVSAAAVPSNIPKPKVPVTTPTPIPGKSPTPLPQGTRVGIGKTGVPVDAAYFGSSLAQMHIDSKPGILLADDDKRIRIVFRLCIERMGFRVIEAEDGNEAWKKIQQGGLALVCLDMKMPGLHGLEVLQRMVNSQIDTPVIICSAYDQLKDEFLVATHPKLRYLVKPVASEALEKAVKDLIGEPAKGG